MVAGLGHTIAHTPFQIGGEDADLSLEGVELALHLTRDELVLEPQMDVLFGERIVGAGELVAVESVAASMSAGGHQLRLLRQGPAGENTTVGHEVRFPRAVDLELMPSGGRITVTIDEPTTLVLSELRFRLLMALLQPPGDYLAGDFVPDELVLPMIWPRQQKLHTDLNLLLHRTRKDLLKAGLEPTGLVERAVAGGSTRFRIRKGASVTIN